MTGPDHTHDHDHGDGDGHDHEHPVEQIPESSPTGSVIVDIGGDMGAAIVTTPETLNGKEIEIRPEPGEWDGTHVAVIPRHLGDATTYAALFPSLRAGDYRVRVRFGPPDAVVVPLEVAGGVVNRFDWPPT